MSNELTEADVTWYSADGSASLIYDLETKHLENILKSYDDHSLKMYMLIMDELDAREGEGLRNPSNLTIEQIKEARRLRRVLLGLPPVVSTKVLLSHLPAPKESLFK